MREARQAAPLSGASAFTASVPAARPSGRRLVLATAVALMGVLDVASAWLSHPAERLSALVHLIPTSVLDTSRTFTLLAGTLLLVTAWGLARGKRRSFVLELVGYALAGRWVLGLVFDHEVRLPVMP